MAQRVDARRNREALLAAAEEVFAEEGAGAPLDRIARRAGLGRGTLYRHFPDRQALAVAVYERRLADLEEQARLDGDAPDLLERLVLGVAERQTRVPGLVAVLLATPDGGAELGRLTEVTRRIVSGPLDEARAAGAVREDVTPDDLMLLFAMVEGIIHGSPPERVAELVRRGCRLVLDGLRSTPRAAARSTPGPAATG